MKSAQCAAALVSCLFLMGCGTPYAASGLLTKVPSPPLHPKPDVVAASAPDLRIPADAVASTEDIPLVPVPPVPLGRGPAPQPTAPPVPASPPGATTLTADAPPAAASAPMASAPMASTDSESKPPSLRQVQQQAATWYAGVDSYIVRLTRREQVGGEAKPEELLMFKFRKEPWSLHFKWLGKVGQDREVLYVKGQYENQIHTRLAAGDMPFMPAGYKMSLPVDSTLVRSASRHAITEAGLGASIGRLGAVLDAQERGDKSHGVLADLGMQKRPEFTPPVRAAELTLPPGAEESLPNGGRRQFFFDPEHQLPLLVIAYDEKNQEVEYYHYDRLQAPCHLDGADFDPETLWGSRKPAGKQ